MRVIPHSGRELSLAMAIIFNTLAEDVHTTPQGSTKGHTSHTCAKTETLSSHLAHVHKDRGFYLKLIAQALSTYSSRTCNAHRLSSPYLSLGSAALVNPLKGITGPRPRVGPNPEWMPERWTRGEGGVVVITALRLRDLGPKTEVTYRALPYYYLLTLYVLSSQESGVARLAFGPTNVFE